MANHPGYIAVGAVMGNAVHMQTRYLAGGVSPHPLQRSGEVGFAGMPVKPAYSPASGAITGASFPAAQVIDRTPPTLTIGTSVGGFPNTHVS